MKRDINKINEELLGLYKDWLGQEKIKEWIKSNGCKYQDLKKWFEKETKEYTDNDWGLGDPFLSEPFFVGLPKYSNDKPLIMVVGQETDLFGDVINIVKDGTINNKNLKKSQDWTIKAVSILNGSMEEKWNDYENNLQTVELRSKPFFNFLRELAKCYNVCWNNLDKIHYTAKLTKDGQTKNKTGKLYCDDEKILGGAYFEGKSLLQKEIEIVTPDCVLFVTGPNYKKSMDTQIGKIFDKTPNSNTVVVTAKDKQYFWTYHPQYLQRKEWCEKVLKELQEKLKF